MPRRRKPLDGGIRRVRAFDARHQPLHLDAPDDWDDGTTVYFVPAVDALRFIHSTRRGHLDGVSRLIAYWTAEPAGGLPRVYVTRYGRGCGATVSSIPVYATAPEMLPALPRSLAVDCGCTQCKQHRKVRRMYPAPTTRKVSA